MLGHASIQTTAGYGGGASLHAVRGAITGLVFAGATPAELAKPLSSTDPLQPAFGEISAPPLSAPNEADQEGATPDE
jgi:hypothetical protein